MRIFLTGASGFVGGAVAQKLRSDHAILAMSRSKTSDEKIIRLGVEPVRASLGEVDPGQLDGIDAIIHCAAYVEEWGPYKTYHKINVDGTKQLLECARSAGVKRFVHVGTEAALFRGQHMRDVDEDYPLAFNSPFPYSRTKALAEQAVRNANNPQANFTTIVIRPRMVWGPGDQTILPVVVAMAKAGKFIWVDQGATMTSTTHIDNLVHGIDLALTKGAPGAAYFVLDGEPLSLRNFLTRYLATAGVTLGDKSAPGWLIRGAANLIEPLWRLSGAKSPPPITRFAAHIMSRDCTLKDGRAKVELGYKPVITLEDGMAAL
jgi:nucleoside-diphosphate-sugar epimerase